MLLLRPAWKPSWTKSKRGALTGKKTLEVYTPFKDKIAEAAVSMRDIKRMEEPTDLPCEKCGKALRD